MKTTSFISLAVGGLFLAALTWGFGLSALAQSSDTDASATKKVAIFAGGCFWCTESDFDKVPGVLSTTSGYIGGHVDNPTYRQVSGGGTGHIEAVRIVYDSQVTDYQKLLDVYWPSIDPIAVNRQFCDGGPQYRSAIFYLNEDQHQAAEASKTTLQKSGRFDADIATEILAGSTFYPAEDYHQDYYKKNPVRYKYYRWNCGRDQRLAELWGKKS